jgi:pimeloyl-ACP methyl ester carboxylesterase
MLRPAAHPRRVRKAPAVPTSRYVDLPGLRMHYLEWGEPGRPDLLLVHGWTGLAETWNGVAEAFAGRYHVVAPDLRGHGRSDKPSTGYRLEDFTRDLVQFVERAGLRRPAYVGHSWGGNIGTMLAANHPEAIACALLEDPVYWKMINAFVTSLPRGLERLDRPEAEIRADARARGLDAAATDAEVFRHHHFSRDALTRLLTDNRDWAFRCEEHLRRVAVPALVLVADLDAGGYMLPEEVAYYRAIAAPGVELRLWPQVGHLMHDSRPEQFNAELGQFLAAHAPA